MRLSYRVSESSSELSFPKFSFPGTSSPTIAEALAVVLADSNRSAHILNLKIDDFNMIILWCDGENVIFAEVYAACHIKQGSVVVKIFLLGMMTVTVEAEQQARELVDVIIEYLRYVVVKLLGVGSCMRSEERR